MCIRVLSCREYSRPGGGGVVLCRRGVGRALLDCWIVVVLNWYREEDLGFVVTEMGWQVV